MEWTIKVYIRINNKKYNITSATRMNKHQIFISLLPVGFFASSSRNLEINDLINMMDNSPSENKIFVDFIFTKLMGE